MADTKKPVVGKIEQLSDTAPKGMIPNNPLGASRPLTQIRAQVVAAVVGGYLASGKLIGSTESKRQVEQAIAFAMEQL